MVLFKDVLGGCFQNIGKQEYVYSGFHELMFSASELFTELEFAKAKITC